MYGVDEWLSPARVQKPAYSPTSAKLFSDMIVVGGGIIGLSCAWRLAQKGVPVRLFDARETGAEASWAGAGMLAPGGEFEKDSPATRMALESLALYPSFVAELEDVSGIAIDYQLCGALELALSPDEALSLDQRAARQQLIGIPSELVSYPGAVAARFFPEDALVNPREVTHALKTACLLAGVQIHEHEAVTSIGATGREVQTVRRTYEDEAVLIAAGAWTADLLPEAATRPVRGHLIAWHNQPVLLHSILRHGHTYLMQRSSGLIVAGSTTEEVGFNRKLDLAQVMDIRNRAVHLLPQLKDEEPSQAWLGFRPGISAGEPSVGRIVNTAIWTAFGHYRNGILLAPVTARRIADSVAAGRDALH